MRVGSPSQLIQIIELFWAIVTTGLIFTPGVAFGLQYVRGIEATYFRRLPTPDWMEARGNPELLSFRDSPEIETVDSISMVIVAGILTIPIALIAQYSLMSVATGSMLVGYHLLGEVPDIQLVLEIMIAISMMISISVFYRLQEMICRVRSGWHRNL